jgi:hypothetical protein
MQVRLLEYLRLSVKVKLEFLLAICAGFPIPVVAWAQNPTYRLVNLAVPGSVGLSAVVAADLNGDHKIDLAVVAISSVAPAVLRADSSGTGAAAATAVSMSGSNVQTPVAVYQRNFRGSL